MRESEIEAKLKNAVEAIGGSCDKFVSPGKRGVPDRICLFDDGLVWFVETKAPGEKPTPLQMKRHKELRQMGFKVSVIDNEVDIDGFIREVALCISNRTSTKTTQ